MKLNIAMICFNTEGRGTFIRAFKLAIELNKLGHKTTVIATNIGSKEIVEKVIDGVKIVSFPDLLSGSLRSGWDPYNTIRRILWLKNREFDIVHGFESRPTVIYPALFLKNRGSTMLTDWSDWFGKGGAVEERPNYFIRSLLRPVEAYFEETFRNQAKGTTVICSRLLQKAIKLGIPKERILQLSNGLNNPNLHFIDLFRARTILGLSPNDFTIGYLGASFHKDAQLMEEAFQLVKESIPNAHLLHIGRTNYKIQTERCVTYTGEVDDKSLNLYLSACNIFWLPLKNSNANNGRFPVKLSDYLSIGRPIVATNVSDIDPFFKQYNVGLVSRDNPSEIAANVVLLQRNPGLAQSLSKNALAAANAPENSWESRAQELESFYYKSMNWKSPK